jgi:hypothetical protein
MAHAMSTNTNSEQHHWLDIFFGLVVSPIKTFNFISNPVLYSPGLDALLGAMLIVIVAAAADSCVSINSFVTEELISEVTSSIVSDLFCWIVLATFARLLAAAMKVNTSIRSCLIVTGWSFVPLLLKAPAACFSNVTILGDILSMAVSFWFLALLLFAFDSLLKLGKLKTLAFVLLLPPCLFFSYLVAIVFANRFILDGFF